MGFVEGPFRISAIPSTVAGRPGLWKATAFIHVGANSQALDCVEGGYRDSRDEACVAAADAARQLARTLTLG